MAFVQGGGRGSGVGSPLRQKLIGSKGYTDLRDNLIELVRQGRITSQQAHDTLERWLDKQEGAQKQESRKRAGTSGKRPTKVTTKPTGTAGVAGSPGGADDALLREQMRLAQAAEQRELTGSIAELDDLISRLRSEETLGVQGFQEKIGIAGIEAGEAADELRRQTKINRAVTQRGLAGRGLALSGVRAGAEGRISEAQQRGLGNISSERGRVEDALRRAIEQLRTRTSEEVEAAKKKKKSLEEGLA